MAAPFNLAVNSEQGRFGHMLAGSGEAALLHSSNLLLEAMGSASGAAAATEEQLRAALEGTSLFLDYLFPIPVSILSGWYGADFTGRADLDVRYVLISAVQGEAADSISGTGWAPSPGMTPPWSPRAWRNWCCPSPPAAGDVAFAFEDPEAYGHLAPYTRPQQRGGGVAGLLTASLPALASDVDTLLSMLDFNPHSIARYNLTDGIEVVEYPRTFRVYNDGVIQYSGDTAVASSLYAVPSQGETPTEVEAVLAARRLAEVLLPEEVLLGDRLLLHRHPAGGGGLCHHLRLSGGRHSRPSCQRRAGPGDRDHRHSHHRFPPALPPVHRGGGDLPPAAPGPGRPHGHSV